MQNRRSTWAFIALLATAWAAPALAQAVPDSVATAAEHFADGDYEKATSALDAVADSDRPWADYFRGRIALRQDEYDEAIERLSAAVETTPESPLFQQWLGSAYIEKLDTVNAFAKLSLAKKAQGHFEEAVRLAPADYDARDALVGFYLNAPPIAGGSKEKATRQVTELKALDSAGGNALQGQLHFNEGEWSEAETAYRTALEADSDNADFLYLVGFAQQQQEKYEEAFDSFEAAIRADGEALSAYYQIGRTAVFAKKNVDRGVECLEAYLDREVPRGAPGHQHAWWRLGMLHELRRESDKARAAYEAALAIDPEHEEAKKALAGISG